MRIILPLAAALGLGAATAAQAAPAMPQQDLILGSVVTDVDWHPSRSHWDHHYHSHQRVDDHELTAAERRLRRGARLRNPRWSEYHPYAGKPVRRD